MQKDCLHSVFFIYTVYYITIIFDALICKQHFNVIANPGRATFKSKV